ncbi:thioredoxin family protein [Epilithonimonas hispanica]|uniref:Thiol:disulfide interchange protein n=1 Tax=Epilithonimonas hispanica TaxID=358687 RepID=A0A3D9CYN9_9FLAO|nr:thioredoxin family protein [Epilithonimonas hispanica]REC70758.1 thiol:disulfide interchange protein [Epilithonimonas hispanica]
MKKIFLLLTFISSLLYFSQGIVFENSDFKSIVAKAKKENKIIFLDSYTTWCGPCKLMAKNIFTLQSVGDYYNSNFINAKIDMEKGEGIELAKKFKVTAYPTYLFIDGNGEVVHRTLGYVEEKDFLQFAKDAQDPKRRIGALKKQFEDGEKEPGFLKNLAELTIYTEPDFTAKVLDRYFSTKNNLDKEDVQLLLNAISNTESPLYQLFESKKADIVAVVSEATYNKINNNLKLKSISTKAYNKETKSYNDELFLKEAEKVVGKEEATKYILSQKASTAFRNKDIPTYEKLMLELYKDYTTASSMALNSAAWNFFENVSTKSSLQTALLWAQESVKKDENYANTDTLANLYNKTGNKKDAKVWAQKSIELAKKSGEDYEDTEKLLNSIK